MIGLFARLAAVVDGADTVDPEAEGVFWVCRNSCRTCNEPIAEPAGMPTTVDESSPIAALADADKPRSTFCSEACREEFVDVFHGDGGGSA